MSPVFTSPRATSAPKIASPAGSAEGAKTVVSHTVQSYDRELDTLERRIAEMGGIAEQMVIEAMDALANADTVRPTGLRARRKPMAKRMRTKLREIKEQLMATRRDGIDGKANGLPKSCGAGLLRYSDERLRNLRFLHRNSSRTSLRSQCYA